MFTSKPVTMKGPVATGALAKSVPASTSTMEYIGSEMLARNAPKGSVVVMVTFWPSASMDAIFAADTARSCSSMARSKLFFTASPSTGFPLWKVTPSRTCSTQVVSSFCSQLSANRGTISYFSFTVTRVSVMPARQVVQPSHSVAGSRLEPNQYKAPFRCLPSARAPPIRARDRHSASARIRVIMRLLAIASSSSISFFAFRSGGPVYL